MTDLIKFNIHECDLKNYILSIFLLILFNSYSQENTTKITDNFINENNYLNNSLQEKYFLHTNKTTYFPGEHIWFKAYVVYDIEDTPYYKTTNLHVNLYNSEKKLIDNKLFFVENGITNGSIQLPINSTAGKYYIELTTQWNKNFKNLNITQFQVLTSKSSISKILTKEQETKSKSELDIQFFPESNLLLEGAENLMFFKTNIINTDSVTIKGKIIDNTTLREVATIRDTINGIGAFKLICHPKKSYTALIEVNGIKKQILVPKAEQKGFIIQQKRKKTNKKKIAFCIKSNKLTIQEKVNQTIFVAIHRKKYLKSVLPIKIDQQYYNYNFELEEANLFNGINTITIFNEKNIPISSMDFYYKKENKQIDLEITTINKTNDSITLNIEMLDKYIESNLSISVLPTETKMNSTSSNIINSFLISPYINCSTPIDLKIFNDKTSNNDINILLQTYPNKLPQKKSGLKFSTENGISIQGTINVNISKFNNYKVMLTSTANNLLVVTEINNKKFEFNNLLLKHPTKYKLALISNTGEIVKSSFNISKNYTKYKVDSVFNYNDTYFTKNKIAIKNNKFPKYIQITNDNVLDEVVIKTTKKTSEFKDLLPDSKVLGGSFTKKINIHKNIDKGNSSALELINGLAGVNVNLYAQGDPVIKSTRGPKTFYSANDAENVKVILNGMPLSDISVLLDINANDVEDIKLNASGAGYGLKGTNGVIFINTKKGSNLKSKKKINELNTILFDTEFGFSFNKVNYEGFELNFINQKFNSFFNTINWFPNMIIKPNTTNFLKFDTKGFKNIQLIINGMNNKGHLISQTFYITEN